MSDEQIIEVWNAWPRQGITSRATAVEFARAVLALTQPAVPVLASEPDYDLKGYALAMRVMQSDLYRMLDDRERAECDALIRTGQGASQPPDEPSDSLYCRQVARLRLASQSTPPPESAGQGLSDAEIERLQKAFSMLLLIRRSYGEPGSHDMDVKRNNETINFARKAIFDILAANRTAQPDGGSKA